MAHPTAHTWEYCNAMTKTYGLKTYLYVAKKKDATMLCPINIREKIKGYPELVSPYGFGGIIMNCPANQMQEFRSTWNDFARSNNYVTAYILQHPNFPMQKKVWKDDLQDHHITYSLDLTENIDTIWKNLRSGYRSEIKRGPSNNTQLVTNNQLLSKALLNLYPKAMKRVQASSMYDFSSETLEHLSEMAGTLLLGIKEQGRIQAVVLFQYTKTMAEYSLNASTDIGRKHTRFLIWNAIIKLKELNIPMLNLGGGIKPGDPLDSFKRRFGGESHSCQVLKQVFNQEAFAFLCKKYQNKIPLNSDYFPPYWATFQ